MNHLYNFARYHVTKYALGQAGTAIGLGGAISNTLYQGAMSQYRRSKYHRKRRARNSMRSSGNSRIPFKGRRRRKKYGGKRKYTVAKTYGQRNRQTTINRRKTYSGTGLGYLRLQDFMEWDTTCNEYSVDVNATQINTGYNYMVLNTVTNESDSVLIGQAPSITNNDRIQFVAEKVSSDCSITNVQPQDRQKVFFKYMTVSGSFQISRMTRGCSLCVFGLFKSEKG
eukprot:TRINITY_DN5487_c0_g1_i1.p1 TRINITY_DN5487_c0_g1~~TRINITY_DN5487_c0_g1_i1.p1  ORF type:complete len:226 (-),score=15.27 TRINITY_DN5487_c0_g1_i1:163-840(-)